MKSLPKVPEKRYSDDQPRDDHGRFGSGSDSSKEAVHSVIKNSGLQLTAGAVSQRLASTADQPSLSKEQIEGHLSTLESEGKLASTVHPTDGSKSYYVPNTSPDYRYSADQPRDDHGRFGEGSSNKEEMHDHQEQVHNTAAAMHQDAAKTAAEKFQGSSAREHIAAANAHHEAAVAHGNAAKAAGKGAGYISAAKYAAEKTATAYKATGTAEKKN